MTLIVAAALLAVALLVMLRSPDRGSKDPVDDPEELADAEREVRDLDAFTRPDDADEHLPDWGPGAPR